MASVLASETPSQSHCMQTMMINFIVKFVLVGDSNWLTVGVDRTAGQLVFELVTSGQQSKSGTN